MWLLRWVLGVRMLNWWLGARVGPRLGAAACDAEGLLDLSQRYAGLPVHVLRYVPAMPPMRQDNWGSDSLMMAAAQGHVDAVQLLLRHGADPNARDSQV